MIYLGGERLHSGVFWINEFTEPRVAEDVFLDVNGSVTIQRTPIASGRKIVLEAKGSETGGRSYFTRRQVELFEQWEISGQTLAFVYGSRIMSVVVPSSSMGVTPVRDMEGHTSEDIYYGTLTLLEV